MNELSQTPAINSTLLRAKVMTVADPTRPRMIAQFAGQRWKTRRTEKLGKPSLAAYASKNSLVGKSLLASVVLSGADKSMHSLTKEDFLQAMRSKVLNLCEI